MKIVKFLVLIQCFSLYSSTESPFLCSHCSCSSFSSYSICFHPLHLYICSSLFCFSFDVLSFTFNFVIYVVLNISPFTPPLMALFMPNRFHGCPYFLHLGWFNQRSTSAYLTLYCVHHIHSVVSCIFYSSVNLVDATDSSGGFCTFLPGITSQQMVISIVPTM